MEGLIDKMLSRACMLYNSFCNPGSPIMLKSEYDLYIQNLENEILIRCKKEEDFHIKNHEEIISLVEQYPIEVLRTLNVSQVRDLAKKFSELLRASLLVYPTTPEFSQELKLVKKSIGMSYYPHARVFRSTFGYYIEDLRHRELPIEKQLFYKVELSYVHDYILDRYNT